MCVNIKVVEGETKWGEIYKDDEEVKKNLNFFEQIVNKLYEKIGIHRVEPSWESSHLK